LGDATVQDVTLRTPERTSHLKQLYTSGAYLKLHPHWHAEESPWKADQIMRMLARHHLAPGTVSELGCGVGEILKQLQGRLDDDCQFWGYDISPQAIELAQEKANERLNFRVVDIQQEQIESSDLMLLIDVLEHIEDPYAFLAAIKKTAEYKLFHVSLTVSVQTVMRKNGLLNVRQEYGMVNYFTKETLLQTLTDAGYEIVDHFYTTGCTDFPSQEFNRNLLLWPRKLLFALNQDIAARILGGYRLLVLAK